jgi:glucose/arabinose dehydrogenase
MQQFFAEEGKRLFSVFIEGTEEPNLDLIKMGGGVAKKALVLNRVAVVEDGILNIFFKNSNPKIDNPQVCGVEVKFKKNHVAHSVPGETYFAVDADKNGFEDVPVDGSGSHTHGEDLYLTDWIWKKGTTVLGLGEKANLRLPVGVHMVDLTVIDNAGNDDTYTSEITVLDGNFPKITGIVPSFGSIAGGEVVTIVGSGFDSIIQTVKFGLVDLTGKDITFLNSTAIAVVSPSSAFGVPVSISVTTAVGTTKPTSASTYTYVSPTQIYFEIQSLLQNFQSPSSVAFGPDGKLYVSTTKGKIGRFLMNDDYTAIVNVEVVATCATNRAIIGIAFDPNDADVPFPPVYFAHSKFYHDESRNSVGMGVNGKISRASGANLDSIIDIVSNLPVSQHDHGTNGMEFGDNGELYFLIGGNTNGGKEGELSTSGKQRESFFSGATLVAHLGQSCFNGQITYDAVDDGSPVTGYGPNGVEIFSAGNRNPYDLVLHSNGYLYGTDNGPNNGFGDMTTGCGPGELIPDKSDTDKLNLLERGNYYGHPNHKRAAYLNDGRQCKWRTASETSDASYTAPLTKLTSSTNGIVEFQTNHFGGLMRGNLVVCKYQDGLKRIILTPDGRGVESVSMNGITLSTAPEGGGDDGLDVTQAPNGNLILGKFGVNAVDVLVPLELPITVVRVVGVFPRRGPLTGGTQINVFGNNFGSEATVLLGGKPCSNVQVISTSKIVCKIPIGGSLGTVDLSVSMNGGSSTLSRAYRYIRGVPESSTC